MDFKPYLSRAAYITPLGEQDEIQDEKIDEKCPFCWGSLCPTVVPAARCIGPPIQLPYCGKMYGKACILIQVSNENPEVKHCPCCRRKMWKGPSHQELTRETWIGIAGPEGWELLQHPLVKCALFGIIAELQFAFARVYTEWWQEGLSTLTRGEILVLQLASLCCSLYLTVLIAPAVQTWPFIIEPPSPGDILSSIKAGLAQGLHEHRETAVALVLLFGLITFFPNHAAVDILMVIVISMIDAIKLQFPDCTDYWRFIPVTIYLRLWQLASLKFWDVLPGENVHLGWHKQALLLIGPAVAVLAETGRDVYDEYRYLVELELGEDGVGETGMDVDDADENGVDEDDVDQNGVNGDDVDEDDVEDDDAKDALRLDQIANQIRCQKSRLDESMTSQGEGNGE